MATYFPLWIVFISFLIRFNIPFNYRSFFEYSILSFWVNVFPKQKAITSPKEYSEAFRNYRLQIMSVDLFLLFFVNSLKCLIISGAQNSKHFSYSS